MKRVVPALLLLSCACAAVQYRHDLPETVVALAAAPAEVHTAIVREASASGWSVDLNDRDARVVEALDRKAQPGFFTYFLRYHFTYEPTTTGTRLTVRAQVLAEDGQDYSEGGSTTPAKEAEAAVAARIRARLP